MAISRDMTATEANILNYIKKYATNEMPVTAFQLRKKISPWQENDRKHH